MDDDNEYSSEGTVIAFEYGELSARVIAGQNLSPDYMHTIVRDLAREIVNAAKDLGMTYANTAIKADDAE